MRPGLNSGGNASCWVGPGRQLLGHGLKLLVQRGFGGEFGLGATTIRKP
jgi:hypothetical protein